MFEYLVAIPVALILGIVYYYNSLVVLRNRIDSAWSQMDMELKKRYDLMPDLVKAVKKHAKHEKKVFIEVMKARAQMAKAKTVKEQAKAQNIITAALRSLFIVSENYPRLEESKDFMILQEELSGIEDKIAHARRSYNGEILRYRNSLEGAPSKLIARSFGFKAKEYFEIEERSRERVKVNF